MNRQRQRALLGRASMVAAAASAAGLVGAAIPGPPPAAVTGLPAALTSGAAGSPSATVPAAVVAVQNAQARVAQKRLAADRNAPHAGRAEAVTHPAADHMGSGARGATPEGTIRLTAATVPPGLPGMDVSSYQGDVDWTAAAADGAQFAYVKATEGTYYTDSYFAQYYNGSYNAGMIRGAYHFAIPDDSTGAVQAQYFVANGGGWSPDGRTLPGTLDIEFNPYGAECYGLTPAQMVSWISSFVNEYHSLTQRFPTIYTNYNWWVTCTGNSPVFSAEGLAVAEYGVSAPSPIPASWPNYTIWQWADSGVYPGDEDVFNGSPYQLSAYAYGFAPPELVHIVTPAESRMLSSAGVQIINLGGGQYFNSDQLVRITTPTESSDLSAARVTILTLGNTQYYPAWELVRIATPTFSWELAHAGVRIITLGNTQYYNAKYLAHIATPAQSSLLSHEGYRIFVIAGGQWYDPAQFTG